MLYVSAFLGGWGWSVKRQQQVFAVRVMVGGGPKREQ